MPVKCVCEPSCEDGADCYAIVAAPNAHVALLVRGDLLTALLWDTAAQRLRQRLRAILRPGTILRDNLMPGLQRQLRQYFNGEKVDFDVAVGVADYPSFSRAVLAACAAIPYGNTVTYRDLAQVVGRPQAARAVGTVMARNHTPVVIPCHRVLAAGQHLGGYSAPGGLAWKRCLLEMERSVMCR